MQEHRGYAWQLVIGMECNDIKHKIQRWICVEQMGGILALQIRRPYSIL